VIRRADVQVDTYENTDEEFTDMIQVRYTSVQDGSTVKKLVNSVEIYPKNLREESVRVTNEYIQLILKVLKEGYALKKGYEGFTR